MKSKNIVLIINDDGGVERREFLTKDLSDAYYEEISKITEECEEDEEGDYEEDPLAENIVAGVYLELENEEYYIKESFYDGCLDEDEVVEIDELFIAEMYELNGELDDNN